MLIRKLILISFFLLIFLALPGADQEKNVQGQYDVQLGTVKITNTSVLWFGVYEEGSNLMFLKTNQLVKVEKVQLQFYDTFNESSTSVIEVTIKDYAYYNTTSNQFVDLVETKYDVFLSQGFGFVDIEFQATAEERKIIINVLDTRFVLFHKSFEGELPFAEDITLAEYQGRLMLFGIISVVVSVVALSLGYIADKKAKDIPIPKQFQSILFVAVGLLVGVGSALTAILGDLFVNEILYFSAIAIATFLIGIFRHETEFKEWIGITRNYNRGKEVVNLATVRLYRHEDNLCFAKKGFFESIRRLFNNHIIFICDYNHSIIVNKYDKGFELEWVGYRKARVLEWVTVASHKLPSRMVSDLNQRISFYEDAIRELENEFSDAKSNYEVEFHRRMAMNFEAHYSKMGVNLMQLDAIDDETFELAKKLTGKSVEEIKKEIKKEEAQIRDTSKPFPSRVSGFIRSFR